MVQMAYLRAFEAAGEEHLLPVLREHDRSQHAERKALLQVMEQSRGPGALRLYASHTLCISCLAVCCQFVAVCHEIQLLVEMDVWRETVRWTREEIAKWAASH